MKEGGIFTILDNCLQKLSQYNSENNIKIIALVGDKSKFEYTNIEFLEFPKSKKNWLFRLYYEYYYFKKLSIKIKPDVWLSLHDMSPNIECNKRFVYCHHPTIFYKPSFKDWKFDYKIGVFSILYKYLQKINIRKNTAVFVQQHWIKNEFKKLYTINNIVVSKPQFTEEICKETIALNQNKIHFFYPSFPRSFKNFEIIYDAVALLEKEIFDRITIHLTLDKKNTDKYSKYLFEKYKDSSTINFTGILSKSEISKYYNAINCLLFPSKLETWGLPIMEAKAFNKPMFLANLPYAKETVGKYNEVSFFDVNNPQELATLITNFVEKKIVYQGNKNLFETKDQLNNWFELFDFMLKS